MFGAIKARLQSASAATSENRAACLIIAACAAWIGWMALSRTFLQTNTESDFSDPFWPEAMRFLAGVPMLVHFHPPGYPVLLATVYQLVGDAMQSALVISWTSALFALVASYVFYRRVGGALAGIGAVTALAASTPFFLLGAMATSDVFFFCIWTLALLVASYALDSGKALTWLLAGIVAGCVILCRTNGIVIGMLIVAPFLTASSVRDSVRNAVCMALGVVAPIAIWAVYANKVGSPVMPTKNFANLALTYFSSGGRISGEAMVDIERQFHSLKDVLLYDPATIARTYAKDFLALPRHLLTDITWLPLAVLGVLGVLFWLRRWRDPQVLLVLLPAIAAVFFLNLKAYEPRYFLFIVPLLGAAIGHSLGAWLDRSDKRPGTAKSGVIGLTVLAFAALAVVGPRAYARLEDPLLEGQLEQAIPAAVQKVPPDGVIVARKENLAFHAERSSLVLPELRAPADLCHFLQDLPDYSDRFVFAGLAERRQRPEIAAWIANDPLPSWLQLTAEGTGGGGWRLVKLVDGAECGTADTSPFPPKG